MTYDYMNKDVLEDSLGSFVSKTFNMALLDSGSTKTVFRETRLDHYTKSLSFDECEEIQFRKSYTIF